MEQIGDDVPMLTLLDSPVPQMVDQLVAVLARYDMPLADQVIEVPKVSCPPLPPLCSYCSLYATDQLVEVPTIVSFSWLQLRTEQNVDIPVPGRGGRVSGLQGFLHRQSSTATRSSKKPISERIVEQIVDIPGGGLQSRFSPTSEFILFFALPSWCSWSSG